MGQAKNRQTAVGTQKTDLLFQAAGHLAEKLIKRNNFHGSCHYASFALRSYLAQNHGLDVTVVNGYVRTEALAWAAHTWIEHNGKTTDVALHWPLPPSPKGHLVINDVVVYRGIETYRYSVDPNDSVPKMIDLIDEMGRASRLAIAEKMERMAKASDFTEIDAYLASAPECCPSLENPLGRFSPHHLMK